MMIRTKTPDMQNVRETVFDIKTGLQYQLRWHDTGYHESYQDAKEAGTLQDCVTIGTAYGTIDNGLTYYGQEATDFWYLLMTTHEGMAEK